MHDLFLAHEVAVACPRCGKSATTELVIVADATDPAILARVEAGALNLLTCPFCRHEFRAATPVLFNDPVRSRALAFVPPELGDEEAIVSGLVARTMQATGKMPADYLLSPVVYGDATEFAAALQQVGDEANGGVLHPELPEAIEWTRHRAAAEITRVLTALETVGDLPQLLAVLNDTPGLLDPATIGRVAALADEAEAAGEETVAEVLGDVAAILRAHLPYREEDRPEGEPPAELGGILLGGDLEAAAQYLERPAPREDEEMRRAMLNTTEPELREGFVEHARLFGGLLDSMMEEDGLIDEEAAPIDGLDELEGLEELVEAPTIDAAMLVLEVYPGLVSRQAVTILRRAEEAALDAGQDALASHLEMLVNTIYVTAEDEDALEEGDHGGL